MAALLTAAGLAILAARIKGTGTEPLYLAWGTGTTEPTMANTALQTEDVSAGYVRIAGVTSVVDGIWTADTWQVSGAITAMAPLTITEWGLFDAISGGHCLMREVYAPGHALAVGGTLNFTIKLPMSGCPNV